MDQTRSDHPAMEGAAALVRGGRRIAITVVGSVLLLAGIALLFLPGPGIALVVAGLAVLATEYAWARRLLWKARQRARAVRRSAPAADR